MSYIETISLMPTSIEQPDLLVSLVPASDIAVIWNQVSSMLKRATDLSQGRYKLADLRDKLVSGEFQLWIVFTRGGEIIAAITSTFTIYPQGKALSGQFLGGARLEDWRDNFCEVFDNWGIDNGCKFVEFTGRAGWAKALQSNGYREVFRTYQRDLR